LKRKRIEDLERKSDEQQTMELDETNRTEARRKKWRKKEIVSSYSTVAAPKHP
jgi:hypothetical protein